MESIFYLDDYNLIRSNLHEHFLNGNLKLIKNNSEIEFTLSSDNNWICLTFYSNYQEGDSFKVLHDEEEYDVEPRFIVQTEKFDNDYCPDINSLGCFYSKNKSLFRLWSPYANGAYVVINDEPYRMIKHDNGIFEASIKGDFERAKYHYEVIRNNERFCFKDIFSYVNDKDNINSLIIDPKKLRFEKIKTKKVDDPIIYEVSVRDFSSDINSPFINKGKFKAFLEEGLKVNDMPIGIDYLSSLGVSHIQLMPINNYDLDGSDYSWGYNPLDYNSLYWGYVSGEDAYAPINEFRQLVDKLHSKGLKVNLDVVFNHVYKALTSDFNKMLPYYFFRYKKDGTLGDASYCGNEIRSEAQFVREYFKLICKRFVSIYDIDGLRFDLAGVIDTKTIDDIHNALVSVKKDIMMYGEGWNMGEILPDENRTIIENADKLEYFAFFNGKYRDSFKGNFNEKYTKGYLLGNKELENDIKEGFDGTISNLNRNQTINYLECHDNYTFFDKTKFFNFDDKTIVDICKSGLATVLMSCGIPFIHMGQEFLRSKNGSNNSYNAGDEINKIDWSLISKNIDVVNYFKELINIRRKINLFRSECEVTFSYYYDLMIYSIGDVDIFVNPSEYPYVYSNWITYKEILLNNGNILTNLSTFDIPEHSLVITIKS